MKLNQIGSAPLLVLIGIIGLVAFLAVSSAAPFRNNLLSAIFPKDESYAATLVADCWPNEVPAGAIAGQPKPIWCYTDYSITPDTHIEGPNSWVDEFNHGMSFGTVSPAYTVTESINQINKTQTFFHANHWMTDIAPYFSPTDDGARYGGNVIRPNKAFKFEDHGDGKGKKLVIDFDTAAGMEAYGPQANAWVEVVISNSPITTFNDNIKNVGNFYAYNFFQKNWAFGCILYPGGNPGCALVSNNGAPPEQDEIWQASGFQNPGSVNFGGDRGVVNPNGPASGPGHNLGDFWRNCANVDPDTNCRDRFRYEIWKTGFAIYVNGVKYFEKSGISDPAKQFPSALVDGDVYVYMGNIVGIHQAQTVRFHWDRLAVNQKDAQGKLVPPTAAPDFCLNAPNGICPPGTTAPQPSIAPSPSTNPSPVPSPSAAVSPTPTPQPSAVPSAPASATPSGTKAGDFDNNGRVDIFDYNLFLTNFGRTGTNLVGDIDRNGRVDIFDYNILLGNFGK